MQTGPLLKDHAAETRGLSSVLRSLVLTLTFALGLIAAFGAEPSGATLDSLKQEQPFPSLIAFARKEQIPLAPIQAPSASENLQPGDFVSTLLTLHERGERCTQWLMTLEVVKPTPEDQAELKPRKPLILYSSFGHRLSYTSAPVMVSLRMAGPFIESPGKRKPKLQEKRARFALDEGFLSIGLDRAAAAMLHLVQSKTHGSFGFQPAPFRKADKADALSWAGFHFSPEEERALGGAIPALLSYFKILEETPGLSDIAFRIVDLPSIWSILRHGGVRTNFRFEPQETARVDGAFALPGRPPLYLFPVSLALNDHLALRLNWWSPLLRRPCLPVGERSLCSRKTPATSHATLPCACLARPREPITQRWKQSKPKGRCSLLWLLRLVQPACANGFRPMEGLEVSVPAVPNRRALCHRKRGFVSGNRHRPQAPVRPVGHSLYL